MRDNPIILQFTNFERPTTSHGKSKYALKTSIFKLKIALGETRFPILASA